MALLPTLSNIVIAAHNLQVKLIYARSKNRLIKINESKLTQVTFSFCYDILHVPQLN